MASWSGRRLTLDEAQQEAVKLDCPECGGTMSLRDSKFGLFYGCDAFPHCRSTHGAHPDGQPLGVPADKATKLARMRAHALFDQLWLGQPNRARKRAYGLLRRRWSDLPPHISEMNAAQCEVLIERVKTILDAHAFRKKARGWFAKEAA